MSPTSTPGPPDAERDDTPPHGVPPVRRAALAHRPGAQSEEVSAADDPADELANQNGRGPPAEPLDAGDADAEAEGTSRPASAGGRDTGDATVLATRVQARHARAREGAKRRRSRLTRRGRLLVAILVVLVPLAGLVAWYEVESNPFGAPGKAVLVDVRAGQSIEAIATTLAKDHVIGTSFAFHLWSYVHGVPIVRPGTYQLHQNLSFSAAKTALDAGPNVAELTVVPGMTISEVANALSSLPGDLAHIFSDAAAKAGVHSPYQSSPGTPLEGLIGTGTYKVLPGESGQELLTQMVARFDKQAAAAGLTTTSTVAGLNAYQLVTLASIAQKEGYFIRYMGDVSRVIYNRLADGMHLDMTSTVLYSLGKDGGPVTPQDEQLTTPYNTYLHPGLTPTPICTPSVQAMRAALDPPAGTWLYFDLVTAPKGIMKFASTYTGELALEHEAAANPANQPTNGSQSSGSPT